MINCHLILQFIQYNEQLAGILVNNPATTHLVLIGELCHFAILYINVTLRGYSLFQLYISGYLPEVDYLITVVFLTLAPRV